jgi:ectoine hydroxylase-related dioxygenase (phytanoyl-CoA dioxygenase family)
MNVKPTQASSTSDAQTPTVVLSQDQIDFYHREGYLALEAITTPEEVEWLRGIYDRLFESRAGRERGDQFDLGGTDEEGSEARLPQILNPSMYAPELKEGLFRTNAFAVARQLLGEGTEPMGEHAIFKPARTGAETPWHQDEAYWDPTLDYTSMSIWIPLQPATLENGCMQFIPGSHQQQVQTHHTINHDPRIHGLEVDAIDTSGAVACPIPAGGATIHHNRILHYAGPNNSDIPRRALILMFGTKPTQRAEERDFYWNTQKQTPADERARQAREREASEA